MTNNYLASILDGFSFHISPSLASYPLFSFSKYKLAQCLWCQLSNYISDILARDSGLFVETMKYIHSQRVLSLRDLHWIGPSGKELSCCYRKKERDGKTVNCRIRWNPFEIIGYIWGITLDYIGQIVYSRIMKSVKVEATQRTGCLLTEIGVGYIKRIYSLRYSCLSLMKPELERCIDDWRHSLIDKEMECCHRQDMHHDWQQFCSNAWLASDKGLTNGCVVYRVRLSSADGFISLP